MPVPVEEQQPEPQDKRLNLGAKYHRVDIHGVPLPDRSPTGEGEEDSSPNMAHIDMYALAPTFAVTDISVPIEGGEMTLDFRRTTGIRSRPHTGIVAKRPITWASDHILGLGWDTNLACRAIKSSSPSQPPTVRVVDEVGNVFEYLGAGGAYKVDTYHSFANDAVKTQLTDVGPDRLQLRKVFGTRLIFERVRSKSTPTLTTEWYYRLISIFDRNGNELRYEYDSTAPTATDEDLLVRSVFEVAHPERRITFTYKNYGQVAELCDYGVRLDTATDAAGRTTKYTYASIGTNPEVVHQALSSVTRPAVLDASNTGAGPVSPVLQFAYYVIDLPTEDPLVKNRYVAPSAITDARGHTTSFTYVPELFPVAIGTGAIHVHYQQTPRIETATTADGTAQFQTIDRTVLHVLTTVTDTRGYLVSYDFNAQMVHAKNSMGVAVYVTSLARTTSGYGTALFHWAPDPNGNLIHVVDMSGNEIQFTYDSQDPSDPYNQPMDPAAPLDSIENPTHYQTFNRPATRVVDPAGLNLVTTFRYEPTFSKEIKTIDAEGRVTSYTIDGRGNRTEVREELGKVTRSTFDADGFVTSTTDPDGRVVEFSRTWLGQPNAYLTITKRVVGPAPAFDLMTDTTTDVTGNQVRLVDPERNTTEQSFDSLNRLMKTTRPAVEDPGNPAGPLVSSVIERGYDLNGNLVQEIDDNGNVTRHQYDAMNREVTKRRRMRDPAHDDALDLIWLTSYDPVGMVASTTDPNGNVTRCEYDGLLRVAKKLHPPVSTAAGLSQFQETYAYGKNAGAAVFSYRTGWQPTRAINRRGFATDCVYDASYRLTRRIRRTDSGATVAPTDPPRAGEPTSSITYNKVHKPVVEVTLNENVLGVSEDQSRFTYYDALHRQTITVVDADGTGPVLPVGTVVNDAATFPTAGNSIVTRTAYDLSGNVIRLTDPEGHATDQEYDFAARLIASRQAEVDVVDPSGFNPSGRMRPTATTSYDKNGNKIQTEDANHTKTRLFYDARNRLIKTIVDIDGDGVFNASYGGPDQVSETHYDLGGRVLRSVDSLGNETRTNYDRADRIVEVIQPRVSDAEHQGHLTTPTVKRDYDRNSNLIRITDARGVTTQTRYDEWNRARRVTVAANRPARTTTETEYDANSNVVAHTLVNGPRRQTTVAEFDAFDRNFSETLPNINDGVTRTTTTGFYRNGGIKSVTDPNGQRVENYYDRAGRLTRSVRRRANGSVEETRSYIYNLVGKATIVTDLNGVTQHAYDELYRVLTESRSSASGSSYSVVSAYDANGNRTQVTYPDTGRVLTSAFDRGSRLASVDDSGQRTLYSYDANGNRTSCRTPNGVATTYIYDPLNRVTETTAKKGTHLIYSAAYGYDRAGNRRRIVEKSGALGTRRLSYSYDDQYRLTKEEWPHHRFEYHYDRAGNRIRMKKTRNGAVTISKYSYDDLNRLLKLVVGARHTTYKYDANGNLTSKKTGAVTSAYSWDTANRLIAVDVDGNGVQDFEAAYDYRSRRTSLLEGGTATEFRYDMGDCCQELRSGAIRVEFIRGSGLGGGIGSILYSDRRMSQGPVETFTYNAVGHTVALTGANGAIRVASEYEAFGNIARQQGASENNRLANTRERSTSIGLDNHGMRYYDPSLGRYISRDPAGYKDGLNVYVYVHNNPVNKFDPLGLWSWGGFVKGIAIGVLAVAATAVIIAAAPIVLPAMAGAAAMAVTGSAVTAAAAAAATTAAIGTAAGAAVVTTAAVVGGGYVAGEIVHGIAGAPKTVDEANSELAGSLVGAIAAPGALAGAGRVISRVASEVEGAFASTRGVAAAEEGAAGAQTTAPQGIQPEAVPSTQPKPTRLDPARLSEEAGRMKNGEVTIERGPHLDDPANPNYKADLDAVSPRPGTGSEWHADHMPAKGATLETPAELWPEGKRFVRVDWLKARTNMSLGGGEDKAAKAAIRGMNEAGADATEIQGRLERNLDEHLRRRAE